MKINGTEKEYPRGMILTELLEQEKYQIERVAVELNGEIVPKRTYDETVLEPEDALEVVSFVGGG